jgi:hypothetical protein
MGFYAGEGTVTADKEWSFRPGVGHGPTSPSVQNLACCMRYHKGPQITVFGFEYLGDSCMWKVNIEMNLRKIWYEGVD